ESEEAEVPAESSEVEEPETTETSEETVEEPEATEETTTEESEEAEVPAESSEVEEPETTETSEEVVEAPEPSTPVEENIQPEAPESSEPETPNNDNQGNSGNQEASQPTDVSQPKEETEETPEPSANADSSAILAEAQKHMGTPYVWGGRTPDGFDCSGFTQYVYKQVTGKDIGGYTVPQENAGPQISASQAKPGDLLFWGSKGSTYHVAISMGGSSFIHAPKPGDTVKVGDTQYFTPDFAVSM
ncbi:C40 family peptidase, partial [Tetragenococcus halophilus]|uniref:C40 family peptidase n=2 Tax=Tetragenococcus halophilus TaxID=51669 RepID=UPI0030F01227